MKLTREEPAQEQGPDRAEVLKRLSMVLCDKRKDAISARLATGIEKIWIEDQEFYDGYDDANRHEFVRTESKPTEGGRSTQLPAVQGSTLFPNVTQPFVDAAAARVGDMLLPTDDRNFVIEPTPIPEMMLEEDGEKDPTIALGQPGIPQLGGAGIPPGSTPPGQPPADPMAAMQPPPGPPGPPLAGQAPAPDQGFEQMLAVAKRKAKKAQIEIDDDLTECGYHAELRKAIDDAARLGSGVMKGPVPVKRVSKTYKDGQLVETSETRPASFRVDPWNLFPAPGCGQNIHKGSYIFERDYITTKELSDLKNGQGTAKYLDDEINAILKEGPNKRHESDNRRTGQSDEAAQKENYEIWYFYGNLTGEDLDIAAGREKHGEEEIEREAEKSYPVRVTLVNDRIIKAADNPLEAGEFPYDILPWKSRPNMPWGTGISRQARVGQRIVVAATRNLMDNAGQSSRPHKVITDDIIQDGDPWTWRASSEVTDVSRAITFFVQPSLQAELMQIIQMGEKRVEFDTGMPMILLGMQGNVQETAAGRTMQNNNGNSVLRRIARLFDSCITEPHVTRYHRWKMEYSNDPDLMGDFRVKARGSAALVERDIQNQQIPTVMQLSLNPAFELDPANSAEEFLKSQRFDPKAFKMSPEKKAALMAQQQPPVFPQIEAAKIRETGASERKQMELQARASEADKDREQQAKESEVDHQLTQMKIEIDAQLGAANLSMEERLSLNDIKATLAGITMKIKTQRDLSAIKGGQVLSPPTEPAGRAKPGMAFTQ